MTWMIANAIDGCSLEDIADFSTKQLLDMAGWLRGGVDLERLKDDFLATRQNTERGIKGVLDMVCNQMEEQSQPKEKASNWLLIMNNEMSRG